MSQRERVLAVLRARGRRGVNVTEWLGPTVDGGEPIIRIAARIGELRAAGYQIGTRTEANHTATYVLESEALADMPTLFDLPARQRGFGDMEEAA